MMTTILTEGVIEEALQRLLQSAFRGFVGKSYSRKRNLILKSA